MKARDWAAKLSAEDADASELLKRFIEETHTLSQSRGGRDPAIEGAVREQRNKWRAVCLSCPRYSVEMFEQMLALHAPALKEAEERVLAQTSRKRTVENSDAPVDGRGLAAQLAL